MQFGLRMSHYSNASYKRRSSKYIVKIKALS